MSTLTKIFVVLLVVFAIAFTMSTISFVAQTTDWKKLADRYRDQYAVADTTLRNTVAAHAAEKGAWADESTAQRATISDVQKQRQAALDDLAAARTELARLQSEKSGADAVVSKLTNEVNVAQAGWKEVRDQRDKLEQSSIELEKRNLDLNERVNETTARIVVLTQQNRQCEQQVNILRGENQKLSQGARRPPLTGGETIAGGSMEGVTPVAPVAGSAIRGRVLDVQGNRIGLSVGSADGVQKEMVFVIYRGTEYVGDVRITDVEPNRSAGRVVKPANAAPKVGDSVADEARFGLAK